MKKLVLFNIIMLASCVLDASEPKNGIEQPYQDGSELQSFTMLDCADISRITIPAHAVVRTEEKDFSGREFLKSFAEYNKQFLRNAENQDLQSQLAGLSRQAQAFLLEGGNQSPCEYFDWSRVPGEIGEKYKAYVDEQEKVHAALISRYQDVMKEALEQKKRQKEITQQKELAQTQQQTFMQELLKTGINGLSQMFGYPVRRELVIDPHAMNEILQDGSNDEFAAEGSVGEAFPWE